MEKRSGRIGQLNIGVGELRAQTTNAGDSNHDKWIDVLSIDWGSHKPGGG